MGSLIEASRLREKLGRKAPVLWAKLDALAKHWTAPIVHRLCHKRATPALPKTFNDPIWGAIELLPAETLLLDSPLLQRLRGVRQLGMAHLVYPGAGHDRLEHVRGVVEAAARMMSALERNAQHRRDFGDVIDKHVPLPSTKDKVIIRLAALLHDIGHGPFSHATEPLLPGAPDG
jgi:hypothetical protein